MFRNSRIITTKVVGVFSSVVVISAMGFVGMSAPAGASAPSQLETLSGSVAPFTAYAKPVGEVKSSVHLTIQVWLRPDLSAAQNFADAVSTPGNRLFHHYLSPGAYTSRFGATASEASSVESWLRVEGFLDVHTDSQRNYVRATAPVSTIETAFHIQLRYYDASANVNAGAYQLRANDRPVAIPSSLAKSVLGVTGLDNAAPVLSLDRPEVGATAESRSAAALTTPCSHYYGQHTVSGLPKQFGTTTFPTPICGYSASQIRSAYGSNSVNIGTGQTIALVELGLAKEMFQTLQDYARANHMPAPSAHRYEELSLGEGTSCGDAFDVEEQLDVESSYDLAPGANQLVVGGDSCDNGDAGLQGLFDADLAVIDGAGGHPLASVASNSWEGGAENQAPFLTQVEHAYLVRAAAEGVGMYFSAGDGSGVETPSSDPYATAVGGTTLGLGSSDNRLFETGWSTAYSKLVSNSWVLVQEQGASGGGPSLIWKQPSYQKSVVPPALAKAPGNRGGAVRSVPDISADADPFTGFNEGELVFNPKEPSEPPTFVQFDIGGTSLASPLVAGMVIAAQQGQSEPFGFINPAIYDLAGTSAVYDTLPLTNHSPAPYRGTVCDKALCGLPLLTTFDDQSISMSGYTGQVTLPGYDNMTGIGTPDGQNFISALRKLG
jgi:subtilase family serine protease